MNKPFVEIDQVTPLERGTQSQILQSAPENDTDHLVSVFHFETVLKRTLIYDTITQNSCDGVSYAILSCWGIEYLIDVHRIHVNRRRGVRSQASQVLADGCESWGVGRGGANR